MRPAQFDPCKQWLGIDAVDLVDPHLVLGVSAGETDPRVVLEAAESRLARLRSAEPGPFDMARNALVKRVEEARESVLARIAAIPRAAAPSATGFSMPPPPGGAAARPSAPAAAVVPRVPVPTVPRPSGASQRTDGDDMAVASGPVVEIRRTVVYRRQSGGSGVLLMLIAALAVAAGGLYLYKFGPDRLSAKRAPRDVAVAKKPDAPTPPVVQSPRKPDKRQERFGVSDRAVSTDRPPDRRPAPRKKSMEDEPEPTAEPAAEMASRRPMQESKPESKPNSKPAPEPEPDPEPNPDPASDPEPTPEPEPAPETPAPPTSPPSPAMAANPATPPQPPGPPEPDTPPEPPAEDAKRIDELLRKISVALGQSDFDAAAVAAKEAAAAAKTKPSRERVERWAELVTFAEGFAGYRDQALATVKAGAEYDVDGKKVGVVEIDDDKFIYRYAGKNKTVPRDRIPGGILMAIVTTWFDAKAANDLFIGAYHATKDEPDLDKARAAWQQAEDGGADASLLLPLLDDPILQAPQ